MAVQEKPLKACKMLRQKAQEFLSSRKYANNLVDIARHLDNDTDQNVCLLTLELVFTNTLKEKQMYAEIVPLKPIERTPEYLYQEWLKATYEECFAKILNCCEGSAVKIQTQALSTAMNLLCVEGRHPIEMKSNLDHYIPVNRLKAALMKILSSKQHSGHLINKFQEYLQYDDILFFTWKILPSLTAKSNPNDVYIMNYLLLLEKMQVKNSSENKLACIDECEAGCVNNFNYDEGVVKRSINKIWNCASLWVHTPATHKQLLIVLLEKMMPQLDKPLLLTDFLMDSLDVGGAVGLLALQGIVILIQLYNLDYPNIYAKLYSMFEPEIFHTKFKARLFYLSDLFMKSTHLPETLVAAFVKRLARLALIAPSEDIIIICLFIGNLILRHPGLKSLLNHNSGGTASNDPYIMEERDPMKSNAINSSLWELHTLQHHLQPSVANAARFINNPFPNTEWDVSSVLENTGDDIFDKEIKKNGKFVILAFSKPRGGQLNKGERLATYWNI